MSSLVLTVALTAVAASAVPVDPEWSIPARPTVAEARAKSAELSEAAEKAGPTLAAVDLRLEAANLLLAGPLAPIASRRFLEIPLEADAAEARAIVDSARQQLEHAAETLTRLASDTDADSPAMPRSELALRNERLEAVRAFSRAAEVIWGGSDASEADQAEAARQALFDLAIIMEHRFLDVASTARLWRAYLFSHRGETSRALDLLPSPLEAPVGNPSIALYTRLLRCRLIARETHSYPAVVAETLGMDSRLPDWFSDAGQASAARRTVAFVRRGFLRAWGAELHSAAKVERGNWCTAAVERIDAAHFSTPDGLELLPLDWAAPPLAEEAKAAPAPADDAGPPAAPEDSHADEEDADDLIQPADSNGVGDE